MSAQLTLQMDSSEHQLSLSGVAAGQAEAAQRAARPVCAVVGLGHAGLRAAVALGGAGSKVIGIDVSDERLGDVLEGRAELADGELGALRSQLERGELVLTDSLDALEAADTVMICASASIRQVCGAVVRHARIGQTIILTHAGDVGATRELLVRPLGARGLRVGADVFVAFSPERARRAGDGPRVLGAVTETCARRAGEQLARTCPAIHRVASPEAAEMVALYQSTFQAVNTALAFEIADACRAHGLDPIEVTDGAATSAAFIAHYPSAGLPAPRGGTGEGNPLATLRERGRPAIVAEHAFARLAARPRHIVRRAHEQLLQRGVRVRGARVLVVGIAHTPGGADTRHAPAAEIIGRLGAEGALVEYHDPCVPSLTVDGRQLVSVDPDPRRDGSGFGPEDYDLAIVVTVHPGHDYGWLNRCASVLDCTYRTSGGRERFVP